jgi:hypothetical protein
MTSRLAQLRAALLELLAEHEASGALPTSGRFLFYELESRGIVSKEATGKRRPDQDMNVALTQLRESGQVPWEWITDETRTLDDYTGDATVMAGCLAALEYVRLDPWQGDQPFILTESRSLAGVLRSIAYQYAVPLAATNGQVGGFLHTSVGPALAEGQRILYLGDYDLAGGQIEANTREVLSTFAGLEWERLAVTAEQVAQYSLATIVKHDRRYRDGHAHEAVETEALSQTVITGMLTARLDALLPEPITDVLEREETERGEIRTRLERGEEE